MVCLFATRASAQRIVVDTASTSKYLITPNKGEVEKQNTESKEEMTFSDRAFSIGKGILNRLKARLNLEEAAESIKGKKDKILRKPEDEKEEKDDSG